MLAKQAGSKSGQLIDFEQARSALSRQNQLNTRQEALSDLEATIVRQLNSEREPQHSLEMPLNSSLGLILTTIQDLEKRLQVSDRNVEPPARHVSEDFRRELRWLESRLDDIDARIAALTVPAAQKIVIMESVLRARTWAREASVFEPLSPLRTMQTAPLPAFDTPQTHSLNDAARDDFGAPALNMRGASGARTATVIEALLTRPLHRETLYLLIDRVTRFWPISQPRLRQLHESAAPFVAQTSAQVDAAPYDARSGERFQDFTGHKKEIMAPSTLSIQTGALVRIGAFVAIGSFVLWIGLRNIEKPQPQPVLNASRQGRSANTEAHREEKASPGALSTEFKVNSLKTKESLLSPEPISGNAKATHRELKPAIVESSKTPEAASPTPTTADAEPKLEKNDPSASSDIGDAADQYDHATRLYQSGDTKGALSWLEKSASHGSVKAQLQLGVLHMKGREVPRNFSLARKWLEMAANNGDPNAMHNLAVLYSGGEGRKPDYARASDLFRRAAELGVVDSMFNLGLAYEDGLGVERDMIQAWAWFSVAAAKGDAKAAQKRKKLDKFLDRDELYEARLLADSLKHADRN